MEWRKNLDIGPESEDREQKLTPELVKLSLGQPLYHALLSNPEDITLSTDEVQLAKSRLYQITSIDPEAVIACDGKTLEEAKAILESIESSQAEKAA